MLDEHDTDTDTEHDLDGVSEWHKPLWIASAVFLLALAGVVVWLAATKPAKVVGVAARAQPQVVTRATPTPNQQTATACTLPPGDQTVPYGSQPSGTTWAQVGAMSVPQAPSTLGPQHDDGTWATCFAHSPSGALLAAMSFIAEGTINAPGEVLRRLAVGVPAQLPPCDQGGPLVTTTPTLQIAGYRYESYSGTVAMVSVVLQVPKGYDAAALTMEWWGDDWRLQFPPGGCAAQKQIPDLTGYVAWSF